MSARRGGRVRLGARNHAARTGRRSVLRALTCASVVAGGLLMLSAALATSDPLAGIVLDDAAGRSWHLDDLGDSPVLLVIADRNASKQATEWGVRLAARAVGLAPWRAPGNVAWLSVADLRHVPDYARDAARERIREQEKARSPAEHERKSPLLLDWSGVLAGRFRPERGEALVVLLSPSRQPVIRASGAPTDAALARLVEELARAAQ